MNRLLNRSIAINKFKNELLSKSKKKGRSKRKIKMSQRFSSSEQEEKDDDDAEHQYSSNPLKSHPDYLEDASRLIKAKEREVSFRQLVPEIPSTTYATFSLYNYPAKFIPQVVAYVLKNYTKTNKRAEDMRRRVFDPFAGYGTVGLVSRIYGLDYELWDLNPMLSLLHRVATLKPIKEESSLIHGITKEIQRSNEHLFMPKWSKLDYWFPTKALPFLFNVWGAYHSLEESRKEGAGSNSLTQLHLLLLIPLLKATRMLSYNDGQRQKLSKSAFSKARVDSLLSHDWRRIFFERVLEFALDLNRKLLEFESLSPKSVKSKILSGVDASREDLDENVDLLITSPPYLQAQEYIRNSKLDLFWLGYTEDQVRDLSSKEIPYGRVERAPIYSPTYWNYRDGIDENDMKEIYDKYFWGVLGALTKLESKVRSKLCFFVGSANLRGRSVPISHIFREHFSSLGWKHEWTLVDTIVARRLFDYGKNPATGIRDKRMSKECLLILRR